VQQTEWSPPTPGIIASAIAGLILAIGAVTLITDPPGRVLAGVAGVGLILFASVSWRARPRLAIRNNGLVTRGWANTRVLSRDDIKLIRITEFRRIGRRTQLMEIESGKDELHVFTRWDLGTGPLVVLDGLTAAGYTR
jgi:Bacterial PH domain